MSKTTAQSEQHNLGRPSPERCRNDPFHEVRQYFFTHNQPQLNLTPGQSSAEFHRNYDAVHKNQHPERSTETVLPHPELLSEPPLIMQVQRQP